MKINIPKEIEEMICSDYRNFISKSKIEKKYKIGWRVLENILNKYNIKTNKHSLYLIGRKKKSMYSYWIDNYGKEEADKMMIEYGKKRSILHSGKNNPMYGKPPPKGSGQGWKGWYKDFYFRSLRELSYILYLDHNKIEWESAETSRFRIPYKDYLNKDRTYAPDFLINKTELVEIKPIRLHNSPLIKLKTNAAIDFCSRNGLSFKIIDFEINSKEIIKALDSKLIRFNKNYEQMFREYFLR